MSYLWYINWGSYAAAQNRHIKNLSIRGIRGGKLEEVEGS
jgi:hypothetical protein